MVALTVASTLGTLDSAWESIASQKFQPSRAVHFYKHHYRGSPWLIIANRENENYFRCSYQAESFLALLDGSRTIEEALAESHQLKSVGLLKQDVVVLLANLKSAGLLESDTSIAEEDCNGGSKRTLNRWLNPFAVKFPLIDPDQFLDRTVNRVKYLFNPMAFIVWIGIVLAGLATVALNWAGLSEHSAARFTDPQNFVWYCLLYPLVKGMHEFGHAYATKFWGGAVREMGVTFLVFFPVPYVDSSAAHRFSSKTRRMVVCAAGIMVELVLAATALVIWAISDHGLVRDLAFDIAVIGGISTLFFNANPLLRFDGYYLLSELLEIPNLGTRSDQYLAYIFKRSVLDMPDVRCPISAAGEAKWLLAYGVCSRIYRVFISLFIAFWIAGKFLIIGVLLAVWAIVSQILYPSARAIWKFIPQVSQAHRMRRFLVFICTTSTILMFVLSTPISYSTYSEGIVNFPEDALIRANVDGVITHVVSNDGASINEGELILTLEDIELDARLYELLAQLEEVRAMQSSVLLVDRTQFEILNDRAAAIEADVERIKGEISDLAVFSGVSGKVSLTKGSDLLGRYVNRGDVLGYVAGAKKISALVAIPQSDIDFVRNDLLAIEARLSSRPGEKLSAEFVRELPLATDRLPNRLLGSSSGGLMKVDARDEAGIQLLSNIFLVEIVLPLKTTGSYLGQRIHVRFIHENESIGSRYFRKFSQLVLNAPVAI